MRVAPSSQLVEIGKEKIRKLTKRVAAVVDANQKLIAERIGWREAREVQIKNLKNLQALLKHAYENASLDEEMLKFIEEEQNRISQETLRQVRKGGIIDYIGNIFNSTEESV